MSWIKPITDRTMADVVYAQSHRDSAEPLKGARNASDMNRITGNIKYLFDLLNAHGYYTPTRQCKTIWHMTDVPTQSEIAKIRNDIAALRATKFVFPATPSTPGLPYTHYEIINMIETITLHVERLLGNTIADYIFLDEMALGERDFN